LGEDNSVKLGDFGLSKLMASHDFASTYVGTPFYMSPEICAAERYTLKSDIWSLGCIIYELCSREPPFNAKSHFQLVNKIKEGKISPLPDVYSPELYSVIKDCLKVNPDRRPDTVTLLNLPVVKLMRKEKEVVELGRLVRNKEDAVARRLREADEKILRLDAEKVRMHDEISATLKREWEVKAQLEINRLSQLEIERLRKEYAQEVAKGVAKGVEAELQKRSSTQSTSSAKEFSGSDSLVGSNIPSSSISTNGDDDDFQSSTDLTELSLDSPEPSKPQKRTTRTPFSRAQTMFAGQHAGTPMDVEMSEPSPAVISSLSLSPRRNAATKAPTTGRNIFAAAAVEPRWLPTLLDSDEEVEEDDDVSPDLLAASPTRPKSSKNPFKSAGGRPPLIAQKTAPLSRQISQPNIFKTATAPTLPTLSTAPDLRPQPSSNALKERSTSPNRRLSKIPSSTNLLNQENTPISPTRKSSLTKGKNGNDDLSKLAVKNNMAKKNSAGAGAGAPRGQTLVELAQARAGGRPISISDGTRSPEPKGRAFAARMAEKNKQSIPPPVWDPDTADEMPSPFLVRTKKIIR
jgi:serine/threonine protein kinase